MALGTVCSGRKLSSLTKNSSTTTYTYDLNGLRTKKQNPDGTYVKYFIADGKIIGETLYRANNTEVYDMRYTFDENGDVCGISIWNNGDNHWTRYYFLKSLQGDVLAVYQYGDTFTKVAEYTYDSWGNVLTKSGTLADINPFRYRSYYQDTETGFYYLQSRYYDPAIGRFINADVFASTGQGFLGCNVFAYCMNNPVNRIDKTGDWPSWNDIQSKINNAITWVYEKVIQPVITPIKNIQSDIRHYHYNNTSEEVVFSSYYFSNYNGTVVFKTKNDASFSFGIIGLSNRQQDANILKHEYGHTVQMKNNGPWRYFWDVAIPSVTINLLDRMDRLPYDYYSYPWEAEANRLGGSSLFDPNRQRKLPEGGYTSYWDLIRLFFE